jgi:DNA-binding transcriptional MerR regulator
MLPFDKMKQNNFDSACYNEKNHYNNRRETMQDVIQERLSISEASEVTGYPPYVLRFYEKEFNLKIPRTDNNQRYYTEKEIDLMNKIKQLKERGVSNNRIKQELGIIPKAEKDAAKSVSEQYILRELESIKGELFKLDLILENLNQIKEEIDQFKQLASGKENDILIVENARLKMKLKEKTYELVEIKEKLSKGGRHARI